MKSRLLRWLTLAAIACAIPAYGQNYEYTGQPNLARIGVTPELHAQYSGSGVGIANMDGNADLGHPDLAGRVFTNYALYPGSYTNPLAQSNAHAVATLGVLGAKADGQGVVGIAPSARLHNYAIFGDGGFAQASTWNGSYFTWDNGKRVFDHIVSMNAVGWNIRVVNQELSFTTWDNGMPWGASVFNKGELEVISDYRSHFLVVRSAGNDGMQITHQPVAFTDPKARLGHLLIVGAVDANNVITPYSNVPGEQCFYRANASFSCAGKIKDHYVVAPTDVLTSRIGPSHNFPTEGYGWGSFGGTSAATPHVAGVAALVKQANPSLSPSQIAEAIKLSATDLGAPGVDGVYGNGLVNAGAAITRATTPTVIVNTREPTKVRAGVPLQYMLRGRRFTFFYGMNTESAAQFNTDGERSLTYSTIGIGGPVGPFDFAFVRSGDVTSASLRLAF